MTIRDSLKGGGADGGIGTVYSSRCTFMSDEVIDEAAEGLVGDTMMFMGSSHDDALVAYSGS